MTYEVRRDLNGSLLAIASSTPTIATATAMSMAYSMETDPLSPRSLAGRNGFNIDS
jgi:hypothetical protein